MIETRIDTEPRSGDQWLCAYAVGPAGVAEFKVRMSYLDLQQVGREALVAQSEGYARSRLERMLSAYDPRS